MIVSLHEGENQKGSRKKRDEALRISETETKGRSPEKRGWSTKVLRNRDEGNFSNMGSTGTKMKVKMLVIWNLVRACLRDATGKYNAEIASQASHRKPKQLRQQTKDKKEKKESSSEGSTSDSDGTDSDSDICIQMSHWSMRCGRPPKPSAPPPQLPSPPPYKDEGDKRGKRSLHAKVWKNVPAIAGAFPVFQDQQGQWYHEPLEWKVVQRLKESVSTYGVQAAFIKS